MSRESQNESSKPRSNGPLRRPLRAVVTAGGTREKIDDVRVITNLSTGRFGRALATALADAGVETVLLAGYEARRATGTLPASVTVRPFDSFAELRAGLEAEAAAGADLLLMAAAVSDYSPVPFTGKLSSGADEMILRMTRNPKLLDGLRSLFGDAARLVGFKLLSGVSRDELIAVASRQCRRASLDATVANDLAELGGADHPVLLVAPDGTAVRVEGSREEVARELVRRLLSSPDRTFAPSPRPDPGGAGRVSAEEAGARLAALLGRPAEEFKVRVAGGDDPSPDARLEAFAGLLPEARAWLALPPWLGLPDIKLETDASALEESSSLTAADLRAAIVDHAMAGTWRGPGLALWTNSGLLLALDQPLGAWLDRLDERLSELRRAAAAQGVDLTAQALEPVLASTRPVGVVVRHPDGSLAPWLAESERGRGLGDRLLARIEATGATVYTASGAGRDELDSASADLGTYLIQRGFRRLPPEGDRRCFASPRDREGHIGASVCLYHPLRREVLIGRRKTAPWLGYWAFPGGKVDPGEDAFAAACRELAEETGITAPAGPPRGSVTVTVAAGRDGECFYRVTNFLVPCLTRPEPRETDELAARWVALDELGGLRPFAAGTRRILAGVAARLARLAARPEVMPPNRALHGRGGHDENAGLV